MPMDFIPRRATTRLCLAALAFCLLLAGGAKADPLPRSVRVVYLVSADRPVREDFAKAFEMAVKELQAWYGKQLDGATFRLNEPVVEVVHSDKKVDWFYNHPNGSHKDKWGFSNGLAEAKRLVGARRGDPNYVWVIYADCPTSMCRGGGGATVLREGDLLGLVGKHPTRKGTTTWDTNWATPWDCVIRKTGRSNATRSCSAGSMTSTPTRRT